MDRTVKLWDTRTSSDANGDMEVDIGSLGLWMCVIRVNVIYYEL